MRTTLLNTLIHLKHDSLRNSMPDLLKVLPLDDATKRRLNKLIRQSKRLGHNKAGTGVIRGERSYSLSTFTVRVDLSVMLL